MIIARFTKTPGAELDYGINWKDDIGSNNITASSWTASDGLTIVSDSFSDFATLVRVSGGELAHSYVLINEVTLLNGNIDQRAILIKVQQNLIDVQFLRDTFGIDANIADARLAPHIAAASKRLRTWVGDEAYDDALATNADDDARQEILALAEAYLTMHLAILGINTSLRKEGIVR